MNKPDKKPRADSKLDSLTPESRVLELRDMLLSGASQKECRDWLAETCQVTTTGDALTRFWKRHCAPILRESRQLAAVKAESIIADAGRTDWNSGTMELVKQVSFELMSGQKLDARTAEKFIRLMLQAEAQQMDARKLAILETKANQADSAKDVLTQKLSPEEQTRRLREILK
jgi:hypothetical protein